MYKEYLSDVNEFKSFTQLYDPLKIFTDECNGVAKGREGGDIFQ